MCNCEETKHPGIDCRAEGCYCHVEVYMSLSYHRIPRDVADHIINSAREIGGNVGFSVYFDTPDLPENEE